MGCQTATADGIIERKADYVLAAKDNQPAPHTEIRQAFEQADSGFKPEHIEHVERQQKRVRTEKRHYYQLTLPKESSTFGRWRAA